MTGCLRKGIFSCHDILIETGVLPTSYPMGIRVPPLRVKQSFDVVPRLRMHGALCPVDKKLLCAILFDVLSTILHEIWSE